MNSTKFKGLLLLPPCILLTIVLVTFVWDKQPTIYPYLIVAIALASVVVFSIIGYHRGQVSKFTTVFLILIVYVLLRNVQFIATHYSAMEPGDVVQEYAVINTFSQAGQLSVIPRGEFSIMLTWYSSWPALHSLSLVFANVLGIELAKLPMVLPTILGMIGFAFVYLLANGLTESLKLSKLVVPIALLLYAISPEAIYYGFKFVHQGMGTMLVLVQFYLIYKYLINRDVRILALAILNALLLVATHHYTSFVFVVYLLAFALLTLVLALVARRIAKTDWLASLAKLRNPAIVLGLVALVTSGAIFAWWSTAGTILIEGQAIDVIGKLKQIVGLFISGVIPPAVGASAPPDIVALAPPAEVKAFIDMTPYFPKYLYPPELTPPWVGLLWVRDFLVYAPVIFGFVWLFREKFRKRLHDFKELVISYFLVFSLSCFGVLFLLELFISHVEPYRVVLLSLPFIAVCGAILYAEMLSRRKWLLYIGSGLLVFAVTMSFLGLWGHMHAPVHLYSSVISHQEVGEAAPLDEKHYSLQAFVDGNHLADTAAAIVSDHNAFLYLILSPEQYHKFGLGDQQLVSGLKKKIDSADNLMVVDFNTNLYSYYSRSSGRIGPDKAREIRKQYHSILENSLNKVYDSTFEVWLTS